MLARFQMRQGEECLSTHAGLSLVGALLHRTQIKDLVNSGKKKPNNPGASNSDILFLMIGLICMGKPHFDAIEAFRNDPFFLKSLGLSRCPSSSILRQRIDRIGKSFDTILKEQSAQLIRSTATGPESIPTSGGEFIPLDADTTPFINDDCKKEGVSKTYVKKDGFSPMFCYIGHEGYLLNAELREGKQHCQKNTPQFLDETFRLARMITDRRLLLRMDSGNDSQQNIDLCLEKGIDFIIKRNIRRTDPNIWLAFAKKHGQMVPARDGKSIWQGITKQTPDGKPLKCYICYEVTVRESKNGQLLLFPDIAVDTWWTSLDLPSEEIIKLYHDHGTSEQFHSELKSDMDLERLPSGYFNTNSLIILLGMVSYNILRICGQESLRNDNGNLQKNPTYKKVAFRRRIRSIIQDMIYSAGRLIHSSRKMFISFGWNNPFSSLIISLYERFCYL